MFIYTLWKSHGFGYLRAAYGGDVPGVTCEEHHLNICLDLVCKNTFRVS